ncbi:MAG: DUF4837 family protein [Bacteroidaceae bacterium]|nr:DUF4837 family protein [Bacteroidaceae bacterium]
MKQFILKVCMMLLAVMVTVACGNGAQKGEKAQEGAQTEAKAKTGKAKKSKNTKKTSRKKKKSVFTPTSAGAPYEVLLVAGEEDFRTGAVDSLYNILTDDMPGIAQSEPCFKVSRINQQNLSKTLRLCRNIIQIKIDPTQYTTAKFKYSRDVYAAPQLVVTLQAHDANQFKDFVADNSEMISQFFTRAELNRQIDILREDHQPVFQEQIKKVFGADMWIPAELTKVTTGRHFVWARCERFVKKVEQELNIVVYSYPYRDVNTFTEKYFIHKRDSVMKANIPGPKEGQYMMTTKGFTLVSDETVHRHYAQVVRGLWNIKDYDMGGPFVSVARVDEENQRVVVAEAFVYYPNHAKRDYIRKLEAALYTLRLPDELHLEKFTYDLDEILITPEN